MSALEELMSAALGAPEERRAQALKVLKGEAPAMQCPSTGPLLIGMSKAAELLGVSRPTLWRICKRGTFEKVEILPGSFRLRKADLEAFVASSHGRPPQGQISHEADHRSLQDTRDRSGARETGANELPRGSCTIPPQPIG